MALVFDPETGEWVDADTNIPSGGQTPTGTTPPITGGRRGGPRTAAEAEAVRLKLMERRAQQFRQRMLGGMGKNVWELGGLMGESWMGPARAGIAGFTGSPRLASTMTGGARLAALGAAAYGLKKGYNALLGDKVETPSATATTPDVQDYRKKATKNVLGRLSFDEKNTFSKDDLKYMMSQQDSKVTSAISKLAQGEGKQAYVDALKQVATGKASASTLNNMIVKAMGPDAKASKGPIYLPGTYKLGDKSYMMAIDNTEEGSPRLVRMAIGGKELEFDPYKPEQTK